jgi:hypothetical protein
MKQNSLQSTGLSLSQAQSISNLCNQRAKEIDAKLTTVNNYSKTVQNGGETLVTVTSKPLPSNAIVVELLKEKASLHATQAFLMENIKAKDLLIKKAKNETVDYSAVLVPERPILVKPVVLPEVTEEWGWEQLSVSEVCSFLEAEAYAAHIGEFIHQGKTLDVLRRELPNINPIEWMVIKDGEKTPVKVNVHHTSDKLLTLHEELAALHRNYEQNVNYYKAKVKNLTTIENARIAKLNADAQHDAQKANNEANAIYQKALSVYGEETRTLQSDFEKVRQENIKNIASLRINVDERFQQVVNLFLAKLPTE